MRRQPRRKGERVIDFLKYRVVIFWFPFFVEVGLLTALTTIQFGAEPGNHPQEAL
jgi:hypothetical protein